MQFKQVITFRRRRWKRVLPRVALALAVLIATIGGCSADRLILGSDHRVVSAEGIERRIVHVDGEDVECWVALSPAAQTMQPRAFAVFLPGKSDRADRWTRMVADAWKDRPIEIWGVNYPGAGGSTGPPRLSRVTPAVLAVYDEMRRKAGGRPIFVQAASFGGAVGLDLARHRPVAGMILQNTPPLRQLLLGHYGWWNLWLLAGPAVAKLPSELDALDNARALHVPAVFIQCTNDSIVPASYQQRVYDAYAGPKHQILVQGGGHSSPLTNEASHQLDIERSWIWDGPVNRVAQ